MVDLEELENLCFSCLGKITLNDGGKINIDITKDIEEPCVYIWIGRKQIKPNTKEHTSLYVGKARELKKRMVDHNNSFKYEKGRGKENADSIKGFISGPGNNNEIIIYARKSCTLNVFGEEVSLYSAEEDAIAKKLSPEWNKEKFIIIPKTFCKTSFSDTITTTRYKDSFIEFCEIDFSTKETLINIILKMSNNNDIGMKIVGAYSNQPRNIIKSPYLVFCKILESGRAQPGSRLAWIPLVRELYVNLPVQLKKRGVNEPRICKRDGVFSPKDTDKFLENWKTFISKDKLEKFLRGIE